MANTEYHGPKGKLIHGKKPEGKNLLSDSLEEVDDRQKRKYCVARIGFHLGIRIIVEAQLIFKEFEHVLLIHRIRFLKLFRGL
jgi:hypothetical protein